MTDREKASFSRLQRQNQNLFKLNKVLTDMIVKETNMADSYDLMGQEWDEEEFQRRKVEIKDLKELLKRVDVAFSDWIHTHCPDFCEAERIKEAQDRIFKGGGTLFYAATFRNEIDKALNR